MNFARFYGKTACGISKRSPCPLLWLLPNPEEGHPQHLATWRIRHRYPGVRPNLNLKVCKTLAGLLATLNGDWWPWRDHYTWRNIHYRISLSVLFRTMPIRFRESVVLLATLPYVVSQHAVWCAIRCHQPAWQYVPLGPCRLCGRWAFGIDRQLGNVPVLCNARLIV